MTDIWVTGMGLRCALGSTLPHSWQALLKGACGIKSQVPFAQVPFESLSSYPLGLISDLPICLTPLIDPVLKEAIADACLSLDADALHPTRWGVVVGSSRGYQADLEILMAQGKVSESCLEASWLNLYGQSPAVQIAQHIRQSGPVLSPRAACATGLWAIAQAMELIQTGQCDVVITGAAEAPVTPLTLAGFQNMGALSKIGAFPFDRQRSGFALAEGAALLVLERRDHAESRGAAPYGQMLGFGLTNDAYHCSAPNPDWRTAKSAILDCLQRSRLQPQQISYIHAHGTGTTLNDEREAAMIEALFPCKTVAVSSTKGATGHTLGASGALGVVFSLMALSKQILPPCVGLVQPAYDLNWVFKAQPTALDTALCLSFGFGGQNAAIALGQIPSSR
jgi:3-oxoacyl-[acyl-carrier-protein] synthase II